MLSLILGYYVFAIVLALLGLIVLVVVYGLGSYGLYRMAKNRGIKNAWLAWVPVMGIYLVGAMVDEMTFYGHTFTNLALLTPAVTVVGFACYNVPIVGRLLWIASWLFTALVHYNLFRQYRGDLGSCIVYSLVPFAGYFLVRGDSIVYGYTG